MPFGVVSGVGLGMGVSDFGDDCRRERSSNEMSTADESSHSVMGTLHPNCSATCVLYVTLLILHCPTSPLQKKEICPLPN